MQLKGLRNLACWTPVLFFISTGSVHAMEEPDVSGFLQYHHVSRTNSDVCTEGLNSCDVPFSELAAQLTADGYFSKFAYLGTFELRSDVVKGDLEFELRELYADYSGDTSLFRFGRQIHTWGVGDLLFINDTFPKDWEAFFSGKPTQYMKLGSNSLSLNWFYNNTTLDLVIAEFRPDNYLQEEHYIQPQPSPPRASIDEPSDLETSVKVSTSIGSWELSGYMHHTYYRSPTEFNASSQQYKYPKLNTYGASLTGPLSKGVVSIEGGHYRFENEQSIPNADHFRWLIGYSQQLFTDSHLGLQLYSEEGQFDGANARELATVRITQYFKYQTIRLSLFSFWSFSDGDHYMIPTLRYSFRDDMWFELGGNIFGGDDDTQFGSLHENSNIFITGRFSF